MKARRTFADLVTSVAGAAALMACPVGAKAVNLDYESTVGMGESDNITRVPTNQQDETIGTLGMKFSLDEQSRRLQADLVGDVAYYDYLQNTYSSEVVGNVVGSARVALVPEQLTWLFADSFGQVLVDPYTPPTPDNRENINYFSTGPDASFALGAQTRLMLGARYNDSIYEHSPFDSAGVLGQVGLQRLLSGASEFGVNVRYEDVTYDDRALNADYNQSEAFVDYALRAGHTRLTLDAGYSRLERDSATGDENGPLFRLKLAHDIGAHAELSLSAGHEFSNSSSAFAKDQSNNNIGLDPSGSRQTAEPFTNEYLELYWRITGRRTSISLGATWHKGDYVESTDLNQTTTALVANAQRDLNAAVSIGLDLGYGRSDFQTNGDYQDWYATFDLKWRLSRSSFISLDVEHYDRSSDLAAGDYTENRAMLRFGYGRSAPRSRALPEYRAGTGE